MCLTCIRPIGTYGSGRKVVVNYFRETERYEVFYR